MALKHFLQIRNKLPEKHAPYVMSKSRFSFTRKPWITKAIANSIKSKNRIYKQFCKEKNLKQMEINERQFKTSKNYVATILRITKDEFY